jgi:hypothetical protein
MIHLAEDSRFAELPSFCRLSDLLRLALSRPITLVLDTFLRLPREGAQNDAPLTLYYYYHCYYLMILLFYYLMIMTILTVRTILFRGNEEARLEQVAETPPYNIAKNTKALCISKIKPPGNGSRLGAPKVS